MGSKLNVLFLEDFERLGAGVKSCLEPANVVERFEPVHEIKELRNLLLSKSWDCVLVSDSSRALSAIDALAVLNECSVSVPLLVVSSYNDEFVVVKTVNPGTAEYSPDNEVRPLVAVLKSIRGGGDVRRKASDQTVQHTLHEIVRADIGTPGLREFLTKSHQAIKQLIQSENCSILLRDPLNGRADFAYWSDEFEDLPRAKSPLRGFADHVMLTGRRFLATDDLSSLLKPSDEHGVEKFWSSWIGVPLQTTARTFGVLGVHGYDEDIFDANDLEFLSLAGVQLAASIERRRTDQALRESEERYRRLFDYAPDGIIIADPTARILDINASLCRILDYSRNELLAMNAAEMVEPGEIPQIEQALGEISVRSEHHREWKFLRRDGTILSADVSATRMPDNNILAIVRDISDRKRAESERASLTSEITSQRERLNNIVDNVPGVVWEIAFPSHETYGTTDFVSEHISDLLGYTAKEWLSSPELRRSAIRPDEREKISETERQIVPGRERVQEIPLIGKDGSEVWVESRSNAITNADGKVVGTRGVMIDIGERRRSERALRHSEERYRDLVENAHDIIYSHDLEGNYTSINKAAELVTGYGRNEILEMNMAHTIAPEFLEHAKEMMAAKLAGKDVTAYELEVLAKDGRRIALEVNTRLVSDGGRPVGIQGIARDVTGRKLLEEKFRQSQKMEAVGLLAGGIAHDFNNMLTAIIGYSELTLARTSLDDPMRPNIEEIKATGERAAALTQQLLAFSRKQVLRPVVHNLNLVIRQMDKLLRRIIRENIDFDIRLDGELANIEADPGQLEQVIMNLAVNAQDAMPNGGRLTIVTENVALSEAEHKGISKLGDGPFVRMTVSDRGEGIERKTQARIFEPFFTTKELGKGTGLGLSTVHGIVKQSGGEIYFDSEEGHGTTFHIYLPSVDSDAESARRLNDKEVFRASAETILLVEDDPTVRKLVHEILFNKGYTVIETPDGHAALEACGDGRTPIHLLLTDLVMPKMSGIELTKKFLRRQPAARAIIMSGYSGESPLNELVRNLNAEFIEKPFSPEALIKKVREVLKGNPSEKSETVSAVR